MVTVIFLVVFGLIVVGFVVWAVGFGGMKRRGQSGAAEVEAQHENTRKPRSSGLD